MRRAPVARSSCASPTRVLARPSTTCQVATAVRPSAVTSRTQWRRAWPVWPVTCRSSRSASSAASPPASNRPVSRRGAPGPRSESQYRTGYCSCRIAVTLASVRALRRSASDSGSWPEPGMVSLRSTTSPEPRATTRPESPPGRVATTRASPPPGGRAHSAPFGRSGPSATSGSGRADVNSSVPSGVKAPSFSPSTERVRRRAGRAPVGSTSHRAVTKRVASGSRVCRPVTSRVPSGDSSSPPVRGSAWKASRSAKGLVGSSPAGRSRGVVVPSSLTPGSWHAPRTRHPRPLPGQGGGSASDAGSGSGASDVAVRRWKVIVSDPSPASVTSSTATSEPSAGSRWRIVIASGSGSPPPS